MVKEEKIIKKEKGRKSNLEILRIISILMIMAFHATMRSGINPILGTYSINHILSSVVGIWGILGVNAFIMISVYFLADSKKFKFKKVLKIIFEVIFYNLLLILIYNQKLGNPIKKTDVLKCIFEPLNEYWFIIAYVILYMIHPFLNKAMEKVDLKHLKNTTIVCFSIYIISLLFLKGKTEIGGLDVFILIYVFMYYLKKNNNNWFERNRKKGFFILSTLILVVTIVINYIANKTQNQNLLMYTNYLTGRGSVFIIFDAVFLFYIFKNWNVGSNKFINEMAAGTLGVYILHENIFLARYIWIDTFKLNELFEHKRFIGVFGIDIIGLCLGFMIIDFIRRKTLEKLIFNNKNKVLEIIDNKVNKLYE